MIEPQSKQKESFLLVHKMISKRRKTYGLLHRNNKKHIHSRLVKRLAAAGYRKKENTTGICFGIANAATMAALIGPKDFQKFISRIDLIASISEEVFQTIGSEEKLYIGVAIAAAQAAAEMFRDCEDNTAQENLLSLAKALSDNKNKINNAQELNQLLKNLLLKLNSKERQAFLQYKYYFIDILAFLDRIALSQNPGYFLDLFLSEKHIKKTAGWTTTEKWKARFSDDYRKAYIGFRFVESDKLKQKGGLKKADAFSDIYDEETLGADLSSLKEKLIEQNITFPIAIGITNGKHQITVIYENGIWKIIDPNQFYLAHYDYDNTNEISKLIIRGFTSKEAIKRTSLGFSFYIAGQNLAKIKPVIGSWIKQKRYLGIPTFLTERQKKDMEKAWLNVTAVIGDTENAKKLIKKIHKRQFLTLGLDAFYKSFHKAIEHDCIEVAELLLEYIKNNEKKNIPILATLGIIMLIVCMIISPSTGNTTTIDVLFCVLLTIGTSLVGISLATLGKLSSANKRLEKNQKKSKKETDVELTPLIESSLAEEHDDEKRMYFSTTRESELSIPAESDGLQITLDSNKSETLFLAKALAPTDKFNQEKQRPREEKSEHPYSPSYFKKPKSMKEKNSEASDFFQFELS